MRRKRNNKLVGIYLWKLILIIITIFVVFISVECFFLIEKTVKNFVSGFSEEYNSSTSTALSENTITNEEGETTDTANDGISSENLGSSSSDGIASNDTETTTNGETTVAEGDTLYCTETHTHKKVCYVDIPHTDRMAIYNLIDDINNLPSYATVLNTFKSYTTDYDKSSSDSAYNNYKNYLDNNCPKIEAAYNTMESIKSIDISYYDYIENGDELTKLHERVALTFRKIFDKLNTIPRRSKINNKMTELKNTQDSTGCITYLTEVSNAVTPVYQSFITDILPSIDDSWYQYIINYKNMLEQKNMSDNLSKITACTNAIKDLPKWEDVAKQIETNKTDKATYMSYLQNLSTTINQAEATFTSQNLDSNYYTYVIKYDNYKNLLNVPKILNCAQIIDNLPEYENVTQNIKDFKTNNQVEDCITYLSGISSEIDEVYSQVTAENLNSTYNKYVINYEKYTKLYDMNLSEISDFTNQIKSLPQYEDVITQVTNYTESNDITGYIQYLNGIISTNYENVYNNLINSKKLTQTHYAYIINYDNLKKLYDLQLSKVLKMVEEIEKLPSESEVNFSDPNVRSDVIACSQNYKKISMENSKLLEYIVNYDKLNALENILTNLDKEITITVQYYAYINLIDIDEPTNYAQKLNFIDTSGKKMPVNGNGKEANFVDISPTGNAVKHIYVDSNDNVIYEKKLSEVYRSHKYTFNRFFDDFYVNNMLNFTTFYDLLTTNYELKEIWLLHEKKALDSVNREDFNIYTYNENVYFTRNMENTNDDNAIRITNNTVIRYVYDTKVIEGGVDLPVTFYDYDITDGYIYTKSSLSTSSRQPTSSQETYMSGTIYTRTSACGINSDDNYQSKENDTTTARLGFGGSNTGVIRNIVDTSSNPSNINRWEGRKNIFYPINSANRVAGWSSNSNSFGNCVFGLVKGIENGEIRFSDGIAAPNLFNEVDAERTTYIWKNYI